ncbi:MAG: DEAD/DEAH box helicase [Peptococcaceae bacterium]
MTTSFRKLKLTANLIAGLKKQGIDTPTAVQAEVIPYALQNRDLIGQSRTGSGKTLAYLLPVFQNIDREKKEMQAVILAPTYELVMQIERQIKILAQNSEVPVTSTAIIGEVKITRQVEKLKEKPHIIVGSPGRVLELIKKRKISAHTIKTIVIDEGDKMLAETNLEKVKNIIKATLKERQIMIFSATITPGTLTTALELLTNPQIISIDHREMRVNQNISHLCFITERREKIALLRKLIAAINPERALIFINKGDEVQITASKLRYHHLKAGEIHGTMPKEERKNALAEFRRGKIQLLVASDLAARGLHIPDVGHIINLDLPQDSGEYLHRAGRTGRMNKPGTVISIITEKESALIKKYEKDLKITIEEMGISRGVIRKKNKAR